MNFIHFINKSKLDSVLKNGIKVNDCYHGKGILIYPDKEVSFKTFSFDAEMLDDEKQSNKLTMDKKWEKIGALDLKQNGKTVYGIKIQLSELHWPIRVFIDIQHQIAKKFAKSLGANKGIQYDSHYSLSEVINNIQSERYILEGSFIVKSEIDLTKLIDYLIESGGGIWGANSFDCMIESDIEPNLIL